MQRAHVGEVLHLLAARRSGGDEHVARLQRARGRQQPPLADLPRHLEVLARVAERPRHPAAAGIEIGDLRPGIRSSSAFAGGSPPIDF